MNVVSDRLFTLAGAQSRFHRAVAGRLIGGALVGPLGPPHHQRAGLLHLLVRHQIAAVRRVYRRLALLHRRPGSFDGGPEVYAWLMKAESKGKFVNRLVKEKYRYERLDVESAATGEADLEQLLRESLHSPTGEKS